MGSFSETYNPILFGQTSGYRIFSPSYNGVRFFYYITHYTLHITRYERHISFDGRNVLRQIFPCKNFFPSKSVSRIFFISEITHNLPNGNLCQFSAKPYSCSSFLIWLTSLRYWQNGQCQKPFKSFSTVVISSDLKQTHSRPSFGSCDPVAEAEKHEGSCPVHNFVRYDRYFPRGCFEYLHP